MKRIILLLVAAAIIAFIPAKAVAPQTNINSIPGSEIDEVVSIVGINSHFYGRATGHLAQSRAYVTFDPVHANYDSYMCYTYVTVIGIDEESEYVLDFLESSYSNMSASVYGTYPDDTVNYGLFYFEAAGQVYN